MQNKLCDREIVQRGIQHKTNNLPLMKDLDSNKIPQRNDRKQLDDKYRYRTPNYQPAPFVRPNYQSPSYFQKSSSRFIPDINASEHERFINKAEVKYAIDFIQRIKNYYSEESAVFSSFLDVMKEFKQGRVSENEVVAVISKLFKENDGLLAEFKMFIPQAEASMKMRPIEERTQNIEERTVSSKIEPSIDTSLELNSEPKHETHESKSEKTNAVKFISMGKHKFNNEPELYSKFIKLLSFLKSRPVPENKFRELEKFLGNYPDLLSQLYKFIPGSYILKENYPVDEIYEKLKSAGVHNQYLKVVNAFNQNIISARSFSFLISNLTEDKKLVAEIKKNLKIEENEAVPHKNVSSIKKVHSYRILPYESRINYESNNEILNRVAILCQTYDKENDAFVFLKRNAFEENMFRIEDERFETYLLIHRCDSIIMALEKAMNYKKADIAGNSEEGNELSIDDLEVPFGIIQEFVEFIYGTSNEILESILINPNEVIPVILKRLYGLNREWREERMKKNRLWNSDTEINHYKSLDSQYSEFKQSDKKSLEYKNLSKRCPKSVELLDFTIFDLIVNLIKIHTENWNPANMELCVYSAKIVNFIKENKELTVFYGNPAMFCVFSYIILLYERLYELKNMQFKCVKSSKLAVDLKMSRDMNVVANFDQIIETLKDYLGGKTETCVFEEEIRIFSNNFGYKIFNVDKIISKLDSKMSSIFSDSSILAEFDSIFSRTSVLDKIELLGSDSNFEFILTPELTLSIKKFDYNSKLETLQEIENLKNLYHEENSHGDSVFLRRNLKDEFEDGKYYFDLEYSICVNKMSLRFLGGEDFYFSKGYKRTGGVSD